MAEIQPPWVGKERKQERKPKRELICEYCKKPIGKGDLWVTKDEKPYHVGCAPLAR